MLMSPRKNVISVQSCSGSAALRRKGGADQQGCRRSAAVAKQSRGDIAKIKEVLPHRYPFLLVDKVIEFEPGGALTLFRTPVSDRPRCILVDDDRRGARTGSCPGMSRTTAV